MYVKITNGSPKIFSLQDLSTEFPDTTFSFPVTDEALAAFDIYPLHDEPPGYNQNHQGRNKNGIVFINDKWTQQYQIYDLPQQEIRLKLGDKRGEFLERRKIFEEQGTTHVHNGTTYTIFTDRDSRSRLNELVSAAREGLRQDGEEIRVGDFERNPIYIPATNVVLRTLYQKTLGHLEKCAAAERGALDAVKAAFQAGDYDTAFSVDYDVIFSQLP